MTPPPKDVGASVRARLLDRARRQGAEFQLLLVRYANERLLYRLSRSAYAPSLVLKGATMFLVWAGDQHRPTRDLDFVASGIDSASEVRAVFDDALGQDVEDDGVTFAREAIAIEAIRDDQDFGGVRVNLVGLIKAARVRLQVDVAFGDPPTTGTDLVEIPTLLGFPAPLLRACSREAMVADKFAAMVQLGLLNSRMKDFFDIRFLAREFDFDGTVLLESIRATFGLLGHSLHSPDPVAFTPIFTNDETKLTQWKAFCRRLGGCELDLDTVVADVAAFLSPVIAAARSGEDFQAEWPAGGPWSLQGDREDFNGKRN